MTLHPKVVPEANAEWDGEDKANCANAGCQQERRAGRSGRGASADQSDSQAVSEAMVGTASRFK
jgi:hypothetical protein